MKPIEIPDLLLRAMKSNKVLTKDQERALLQAHKQGDKRATDKLAKCNIGLVLVVTRKYAGFRHYEDLVQEGLIGLKTAMDKFDLNRPVKFSTYAQYWISAMVLRAHKKHRSIIARNVHTHSIPSDMSIDEPVRDGEMSAAELILSNNKDMTPTPEDEYLKAEAEHMVRSKVVNLQPKDRYIVENRLMTDEPIYRDVIGKKYKVCREMIRKRELHISQRLRGMLAEVA